MSSNNITDRQTSSTAPSSKDDDKGTTVQSPVSNHHPSLKVREQPSADTSPEKNQKSSIVSSKRAASASAETAPTTPSLISEQSTLPAPPQRAMPQNTPVDMSVTSSIIASPTDLSAVTATLAALRGRSGSAQVSSEAGDETNEQTEAEYVHESDTWKAEALEDLEQALKRLATTARDDHKIDASKSVEEYYSEAIAAVLERGEIEFDSSYLE